MLKRKNAPTETFFLAVEPQHFLRNCGDVLSLTLDAACVCVLLVIRLRYVLYWMRWNIETFFKTIKYYLIFDDVHSFSAECIKQEVIWFRCRMQR